MNVPLRSESNANLWLDLINDEIDILIKNLLDYDCHNRDEFSYEPFDEKCCYCRFAIQDAYDY